MRFAQYAWTYAKQYFLRVSAWMFGMFRLLPVVSCQPVGTVHAVQKKRGEDGTDVLNPLDKLYVVHVQHSSKKEELKERWDAGGPLLPSLATALRNFPHKVVELEKDSVRPCLG